MAAFIGLGIFAIVYILDNFRPSQKEVYDALGNDWIQITEIKQQLQQKGIAKPSAVIINHHLQNLEISGDIEWQRTSTQNPSLTYRRRQPTTNQTPSSLFS